jgi:hypothetical protein
VNDFRSKRVHRPEGRDEEHRERCYVEEEKPGKWRQKQRNAAQPGTTPEGCGEAAAGPLNRGPAPRRIYETA